ncbi:MAG TPA: YihY/virulence factor BrkB family protein [Thermodesulfobacteriota bacterium]
METLARVYDKLGRDNVFFMAAGLAFSVVTTLIPLLVLLFAAVGYALASSDTATREVMGAIQRFLPFASEEIVGSLLAVVQSRATIGAIGLLGLIWVSTGVVSSIRTVLNTVFEVPETRSLVAGKIFDVVMVFVLGIFFLLSIGFTTVFAVVQEFGVDVLRAIGLRTDWVAPTVALGGALVVNVLMFTLLYTTAPARGLPILPALAGGTVTAVLFEVAKQAFRVYIDLARQGTLGPASGSLGALVLLLIWVYYSALVFILGAEAGFAVWMRTVRSGRQASGQRDRVGAARDAERLARG